MNSDADTAPFGSPTIARATFEEFKVAGERNLFVVGTFDRGVTILSQQVRALNLVWALIEYGGLAKASRVRKNVAVVGAGFAGLTVAAGLLSKGPPVNVTLFEKRDTVLPLQQGCDTRWVHPHIYDWPAQGTEAPTAGLPLLNWTASRASDVAVQVMRGWEDVLARTNTERLRLYCNTHHLQLTELPRASQIRAEWVAERRDPTRPTQDFGSHPSEGRTQVFDAAILALGFGIESDNDVSYWRNETLAQPHLTEGLATYIVSGQGDAAMVDLLRLTIGQFRQDRILAELFNGHDRLHSALQQIYGKTTPDSSLFNDFEALLRKKELRESAEKILADLASRIRRDTSVVLHLKEESLSKIFASRRISFQNSLLVYLLYRCGAFYPSSADLGQLQLSLSIPPERVIRRHGPPRIEPLQSLLSSRLQESVQTSIGDSNGRQLLQPAEVRWPGGYFDSPLGKVSEVSDDVKARWRKEYLPGATEALATTFCSAVSGFLASRHSKTKRLRVTLHRTLPLGREILLQQCSEYVGLGLDNEDAIAGRTFPCDHATIGEAFNTQEVVLTRRRATHASIEDDMRSLHLTAAARQMATEVRSVLAIPLVSVRQGKRSVIGVLYADSTAVGFFKNADALDVLISMGESFMKQIRRISTESLQSLANYDPWVDETAADLNETASINPDENRLRSLELQARAPTVENVPFLNFDHSDFVRVAL